MQGFKAETLSGLYCIIAALLIIAGVVVMFFNLIGVALVCGGALILIPAAHIGDRIDKKKKEKENGDG